MTCSSSLMSLRHTTHRTHLFQHQRRRSKQRISGNQAETSRPPSTPPRGCLSLTDLLDGGGELQAQLDDFALGGGEVVCARQRSPAKRQNIDAIAVR